MQEVIVESGLSQTLGQLSSQAILCDVQGRALGFFSPMPDHPFVKELQLEPPSPLSIAEIEERRKNGVTGKPLSEILKRLGLE
jgi:hypothetical protein